MCELEIVLHHSLYEAVQVDYKDWSCEINTNRWGDCVNVHLMLKCDKVIASVAKYRVGMHVDNFCKMMIEGLK